MLKVRVETEAALRIEARVTSVAATLVTYLILAVALWAVILGNFG